MSIIPDFIPFIGDHCETVTTGSLLQHAGLKISEPMLFGLGEGISFCIFTNKRAPAPFLGGRVRFEEITKSLARNLDLNVEYRQTRSRKKAWENMASFIDAGQPVGVKIDCYFLDHFSTDFHFAAHYVAAYGYNDDQVYVVDTAQQGTDLKTSRTQFEEGRLWKGPMASNALTWTISLKSSEIDWPKVTKRAIRSNAHAYNNPPIKNFGASGIRKAATMAPSWKHTVADAPNQLALMGLLLERAGTGGGCFRQFYADFLEEANESLNMDVISEAAELIGSSSESWSKVANCLQNFQENETALDETAALLLNIAALEEEAFRMLETVR